MFKKTFATFAFIVALAIFVFVLGPRVEVDETIRLPNLPDDLDDYLEKAEAPYTDLIENAHRHIVWADSPNTQTPMSVVYLHGFSASAQEIEPISSEVGKALGANVYFARFKGHGRENGSDMGEASVNSWLNEAYEALAIGRKIGKKVIIISTSTGATAATWLATLPEARDVQAFVMVSPNYGPKDKSTNMLTMPWGEQMLHAFVGKQNNWDPAHEGQAKFWTSSYPMRALVPMMGLVKFVGKLNLKAIQGPMLFVYCKEDQVVDIGKVEAFFGRIGSPNKQAAILPPAEDPANHVIAGDIMSPSNTQPAIQAILEFVETTR